MGTARVIASLALVTLATADLPLAPARSAQPVDPPLAPARSTEPVPHDADDPAIWVNRADPAASLIVATDKNRERGGLYVFGLDGRVRSSFTPLDRPNNVDIEYGLPLGRRPTDIVVATEREKHRLRVFAIDARASLRDLAPNGIPVLEGQTGDAAEPMGVGLYKRPRDGAVFAIVAPKTGPARDYLWEYRLADDGAGGVRGTLVRRFGAFSGTQEIEAVAVDDELGFVYYSDELFGIRKYAADPDAPGADRELAVFGTDAYLGDREGLGIFTRPDGTGFIVSSDQVPGATRLQVYPREGSAGDPHAHPRLAIIPTVADETDGLEVTSTPLPGFPGGLLVMMNSGGRNFLLFQWTAVAARLPATP
jgi:3-phytase